VSARVVVGIDGSPEAETALRFAADEAAKRGLPLRIVCAWEAPAGTYIGEAFAPTADGIVEAEHHADDVLRAALERLAGGAAIETEALAVEGSPAQVLIEQSRDAALLVVGSRGRGAAAGLLLGSVSQKLTQHAPCPLAVVPCAKK
jgi:nucleotide-binding universal stress UspA family protein